MAGKFIFEPETLKAVKETIEMGQNLLNKLKKKPANTTAGTFEYLKKNVLPVSIGVGAVGVAASQVDKAIEGIKGGISDVKHKLGLKKKIERIIEWVIFQ